MNIHGNYMQRAIVLAQRGIHTTTPNPNVGCVIVKDGHIIGEGFHQQAGQPHAEINALRNVSENNHSPRGATAYVTLEPCSHHGRTPPCTHALIDAGIAEVVIGSHDPNPQVSESGVQKLRQSGITVVENVLNEECTAINRGFFKRMVNGLPFVTIKMAMSLDAKIAMANGESKWLTGEVARSDVQQLRAKSCAIMTSSATVLADNPRLNVRLENTNNTSRISRQPKRVIVDSRLSIPCSTNIITLTGDVLLYHSVEKPFLLDYPNHVACIKVPATDGHADLTSVVRDLAENHHCNELLVEAGGLFAGALLSADVVDELIIYQAPMLLGEDAKPAFASLSFANLAAAQRFQLKTVEQLENDCKIVMRRLP